MSSKTLCRLMRAAVVAAGICGLFIALYIIPSWGKDIVNLSPDEFSGWFWPWLIFAWLCALPCFVILGLVWQVSGAVKNDTVFTLQTAKWIKYGAILLFSDAALFFIGNIVLAMMWMSHPGVLLVSMLCDIFAVALALMASVLSRYITKAAVLQEMNEGTI